MYNLLLKSKIDLVFIIQLCQIIPRTHKQKRIIYLHGCWSDYSICIIKFSYFIIQCIVYARWCMSYRHYYSIGTSRFCMYIRHKDAHRTQPKKRRVPLAQVIFQLLQPYQRVWGRYTKQKNLTFVMTCYYDDLNRF